MFESAAKSDALSHYFIICWQFMIGDCSGEWAKQTHIVLTFEEHFQIVPDFTGRSMVTSRDEELFLYL